MSDYITTYSSIGVFTATELYNKSGATIASASETWNSGKIRNVSVTGTYIAFNGLWRGMSYGTSVSDDGIIVYTYTGQTSAYAENQSNTITYSKIDIYLTTKSNGGNFSTTVSLQDNTYSGTYSYSSGQLETGQHTYLGAISNTFSLTTPDNVYSYTQESRRTSGLYSSEYKSDTVTTSTTSSTTETHTYPATTYSQVVSKDYLESQLRLYDLAIKSRTVSIDIATEQIDWTAYIQD